MKEAPLARNAAHGPLVPSVTVWSIVVVWALYGVGCASSPEKADDVALEAMNGVAGQYVRLALQAGTHDEDFVDAYYGPPEWKAQAAATKLSLKDLEREAARLLVRLAAVPLGRREMTLLRGEYLRKQIGAVRARLSLLLGKKLPFDEESRAFYDAVAPRFDGAHFDAALARLEELLPGNGDLSSRYEEFRNRLVVPPERLDTVFRAAIAECRRRTLARLSLPGGESFVVEYVTGKPWSAYNWYQGGARSLIQVNVDRPLSIDRIIDLACHEGYPGHHVYNALLEQRLVRDRGWMEFSIYPLFSPQSLIAEGTANLGIEVAFPGSERKDFERRVLFPLAGLDPSLVDLHHEVESARRELAHAENGIARQYLDGEIDSGEAVALLRKWSLLTQDLAERRVRFFDRYRSYVINYTVGQDLVRAFLQKRSGATPTDEKRWQEFESLLASPRLPSGLR